MNIIQKIVQMEIYPYMKENKNTMIEIYLYVNTIVLTLIIIIIQEVLIAIVIQIN